MKERGSRGGQAPLFPASQPPIALAGALCPRGPPPASLHGLPHALPARPGPARPAGPAPGYTFVIYCAAVGPYFKTGQLSPIDLIVETKFHRAAPGGMGGTKCAGASGAGARLVGARQGKA